MKVLLIVLLAGLAVESSANLFCKNVQALEHFEFKEVRYGSRIHVTR